MLRCWDEAPLIKSLHRLWSKECSVGHNLLCTQERLVNYKYTRGLAWDLFCGLENWIVLQNLQDSFSVTSCVLFLQTSFLVRHWRSSSSHLSVSVGSSCRGGKCMFCFFCCCCCCCFSLCPILVLGTKSTGTDEEKNRVRRYWNFSLSLLFIRVNGT